MTRNVGIFLFDEVEVLDLAGPFEVFATASRLEPSAKPFEVFTVADAARTVRARGGLMVQADYGFTTHPRIDVLIVPGGVVTSELKCQPTIEWIRRTAAKAELTASVCTGAFLLAQAGLLTNKPITTHWEDVEEFKSMFPHVSVQPEKRWIDTGAVITSAGISAGMDMSLHLVSRLSGEPLALKTARQMDYDWRRSP
jgi:transcriptional regulator GlxA family with amidase domain